MSDHTNFRRLVGVAFGFALLTACGEAGDPASLQPDHAAFASSGPGLVECPNSGEESVTGTITATGGSLNLHKHELRLPSQAVNSPQGFRVATPVSNYMELKLNAEGHDSFNFKKTGTITIDYSRCTRSNVDKAPLTVWQIDPDTKELIEYMGGVDDKVARTVTFQTDHLSTFSIAH